MLARIQLFSGHGHAFLPITKTLVTKCIKMSNTKIKNQNTWRLPVVWLVPRCSTMPRHLQYSSSSFHRTHLDPLGYQPAGYHASMHGCHVHSDIILLLALQHHLGSRKENQIEYCSMRVFVLFLLLCPLYESSSLYSLLISCCLTRDHDHES